MMWIHGVAITATADHRIPEPGTGPRIDAHVFDIRTPLRMRGSGSITEHWRPEQIDLEDPALLRPTFTTIVSASPPRGEVIPLEPTTTLIDDFAFDGERYVLIPGSALARELAGGS